MSPQSTQPKPLVDHRVYTIALRKMPEFLEVFHRLAMPVLLQTLGHPLGFYTSLVGPQNQFVHLWGYDSLADYEQRCAARDSHPDTHPGDAAAEEQFKQVAKAYETLCDPRLNAEQSLEITSFWLPCFGR